MKTQEGPRKFYFFIRGMYDICVTVPEYSDVCGVNDGGERWNAPLRKIWRHAPAHTRAAPGRANAANASHITEAGKNSPPASSPGRPKPRTTGLIGASSMKIDEAVSSFKFQGNYPGDNGF